MEMHSFQLMSVRWNDKSQDWTPNSQTGICGRILGDIQR